MKSKGLFELRPERARIARRPAVRLEVADVEELRRAQCALRVGPVVVARGGVAFTPGPCSRARRVNNALLCGEQDVQQAAASDWSDSGR